MCHTTCGKGIVYLMSPKYYIAYENIPTTKYSCLLDLQRLNGLEILKSLRAGDNAHYESCSTAEEFIDTFVDIIDSDINAKLKDSEYISILTDESTDISVNKKLVIYARMVSDSLVSTTLFLGNVHLKDISCTAEV